MEPQTDTGRRLVIAVIVTTLTLSVIVIGAFNATQGQERLPQQIIRFLLTVGLCVFLYRGANWARWVAGILLALAGLGSLLAFSSGTDGLALLAPGLVYMASATVLLFVPAVQTYFGAD